MSDNFLSRISKMLGEEFDPTPGWHRQKALLAFSQYGGAALLAATEGLREDFMQSGSVVSDVFFPGQGGAPEEGLCVWEGGVQYITYRSTPDNPTEYDVEYPGTFRDLTPDEWDALRAGTDPFGD